MNITSQAIVAAEMRLQVAQSREATYRSMADAALDFDDRGFYLRLADIQHALAESEAQLISSLRHLLACRQNLRREQDDAGE